MTFHDFSPKLLKFITFHDNSGFRLKIQDFSGLFMTVATMQTAMPSTFLTTTRAMSHGKNDTKVRPFLGPPSFTKWSIVTE